MKYMTKSHRRELSEHKWQMGPQASVCTRCGRRTEAPCWTDTNDCEGSPRGKYTMAMVWLAIGGALAMSSLMKLSG